MKRLIQDLRIDSGKQLESAGTDKINLDDSHVLPSSPIEPTQLNTRERKSLTEWTSEDIEEWCRKNNLEKWCTPLAKYNGAALIEPNKILKTDANLPYIADGHEITLLDVVLFKSKLHQLLSDRKALAETPEKKQIIKRRSKKWN